MRGFTLHMTFLISVLFSAGIIFGQTNQMVSQREDSLKILSLKILKAENDSVKLSLNELFLRILRSALVYDESFQYAFDSLKMIGKLTSPDGSFRIYNWNLPNRKGANKYFGFIQMNPKGKAGNLVITLRDLSDSIPDPETAILDQNSWYGSLYYRIIVTSSHDQVLYTLLGWDGINDQVSQKIIEVLYWDSGGNPHFGAKIFRKYGNEEMCRVMFRHSSSVSMLLNYDTQFLVTGKKWNPKKMEFEIEKRKTEMIVCDELIPMDEMFEGRYEYYVPSSENYHGFVFQDGNWYFYKNVEFIPNDH
jgi:hypothetical protein